MACITLDLVDVCMYAGNPYQLPDRPHVFLLISRVGVGATHVLEPRKADSRLPGNIVMYCTECDIDKQRQRNGMR